MSIPVELVSNSHWRHNLRADDFEGSPMRRRHFLSSSMIVAVAAIICTALHAASVAPVGGEHGMVVTAHQLATKVGVDVLKRGGNAVDAAVAVGYSIARVLPPAGNLGRGGVFNPPVF